MQKRLNWLKGLFIHSTSETKTMTDQVVDVPATAADTATDSTDTAAAAASADVVQPVAGAETLAAGARTGVQDFEAALAFVESGLAQLGSAAKDELKALAKKYL